MVTKAGSMQGFLTLIVKLVNPETSDMLPAIPVTVTVYSRKIAPERSRSVLSVNEIVLET